MWDVTKCTFICAGIIKFLLTHPVWDVTRVTAGFQSPCTISTHTSRVGCDNGAFPPETLKCGISTHTSRVGCDVVFRCGSRTGKFLLTHPVWDVTFVLLVTLCSF